MNKLLRAVVLVAVFASVVSVSAQTTRVSAPSFVAGEALFWLDASTLSQLPGQEVTVWPDVRGNGYPAASTAPNRNNPKMTCAEAGEISGKPAVDFGNKGSDRDMWLSSTQENVMMVFFVMDIDNAQCACLLGGPDGGSQRFCREIQNSYASGRGQVGDYSIWTNGEKIADPYSTATPSVYSQITYRYDGTSGFPKVLYLASDRGIDGRVGGKRLCEVIAFNRILTDEERVSVEEYLRKKWFEDDWSWSDGLSVEQLLNLAQVRFDASVASSFHYDSETSTKVVQWDDLSPNRNNFTPGETYGQINGVNYGTVGMVTDRPVFDSGAQSSGIDLQLGTRITDTRMVFMVADVDTSSQVFWLGDEKDYYFHRSGNSGYFYGLIADSYTSAESGGGIWCNGAFIASADAMPEPPGELSVYVFSASRNLCWNRLGQDRTENNRNGGKRVAELVTFGFLLPESARKRVEDYLVKKWTPSQSYIDEHLKAKAVVHVDASSAGNLIHTDAGIAGWKNFGLGSDLFHYPKGYIEGTPYDMKYGSYGMTNGVPAFLMGAVSSDIDLAFDRLTGIRAVFWAMDIQRSVKAFFLGDPRTEDGQGRELHFHRGTYGEYAYGHGGAIWKDQKVCCDGQAVSNMTSDKPPYGVHVYDVNSSADLTASALSGDRWCDHRNGGRAISELLIFTNNVWGLSRVGLRKSIEDRWTKSCGWAGTGDAQWGADSYRVFAADVTVPADGAAAKGVGFTADATLEGGELSLGEGGIFVSEGVTVVAGSALSGNLEVNGPGVLRFPSAVALPSLHVGCGASVMLRPGSSISGKITMREGAKLVIDVSSLAAKEYAEIPLGSVALPEGGEFYDYLAVSDDSHKFTLSPDGTKILVNDITPVRAVWKGGDDTSDPANWICFDDVEEQIGNVLPGRYVTNVTLNADMDMSGCTIYPICASGATIDLNGHGLKIDNFDEIAAQNVFIANSDKITLGTLEVVVANNATVDNSTVRIGGNIEFVKSGAGTFVGSVTQSYTGGNRVVGGKLKAGIKGTEKPFGVPASEVSLANIEVSSGAMFDFSQKCGWGGYRVTLNGGTLQNSNGGFGHGDGGTFTNIVITAEGSLFDSVGNSRVPWGVFGNEGDTPTSIDLGSHTLTINVSWYFDICNTTITGDGNIIVREVGVGGPFWTGRDGRASANGEIAATNVNFRIEAPLRLYAPFSLHDYEAAYENFGNIAGNSKAEMNVFGSFRPASHDVFYGCTMQNGSGIDLSNRTEAGKLPFHLTCAMTGDSERCQHKSVTFAPGAVVKVDLSAHEVSSLYGEYVLTWDQMPDASVKFVPDEATAQRCCKFSKDDRGLKLVSSGFKFIVR